MGEGHSVRSALSLLEAAVRRKVEAVLCAHGLFSPELCILVACSGGPDSLALLDTFDRLRRAGGARIVCAHAKP